MRAAFMTDVNAVEVRETEEPKLDPKGAVLRVEACGICGTDARTFFNDGSQPMAASASSTHPQQSPPVYLLLTT